MSITTENTFESALVQSLVEHGGYTEGNAPDYSPDLRGSLDVLRYGFVNYGVRFQMAYFQKRKLIFPRCHPLDAVMEISKMEYY